MSLELTGEQVELLREVLQWGLDRARYEEDSAFVTCRDSDPNDRYRDLDELRSAVRTYERIAALLEKLG